MPPRRSTRLSDLLGAAIVTSYGRADAVPNDHLHYLGHLGRLGSVEGIEAVRQADLILAVGARLGQSTTFFDNRFIPADAQIVQIEIDPEEIGRNYPVSVGIEGDAKAVTQGLIERIQEAWTAAEPRLAGGHRRLGRPAKGAAGKGGPAGFLPSQAPTGIRRTS